MHMSHAGGFVNLGRVDAFDFIQLEYRVDGPLTLMLTSAAMAQYQAIFRFLLRTKHAAFSLRDVWRDLQVRMHSTYLWFETYVLHFYLLVSRYFLYNWNSSSLHSNTHSHAKHRRECALAAFRTFLPSSLTVPKADSLHHVSSS
jgi:hypothetical protein